MRPSPTKQKAKSLGISARAVRYANARARKKAELEKANQVSGNTRSRGHTTAAASARMSHMEDIAGKRKDIRKQAGKAFKVGSKLGAAAAVERLRSYEHQCAMELERARDGSDVDVELAAHLTWLKAAEQLRKSENDAPKVDALNKDQIPLAEVESELTRGILVFRTTLDACATRISSNPLIAHTDRIKLKELLQTEHARAMQALEKVKWEDDEDAVEAPQL